MSDLIYSFGIAHPGAITLHNIRARCRIWSGSMATASTSARSTSCVTARRRAALQRVPREAAQAARQALRGHHAEQAVGGGDARGLRTVTSRPSTCRVGLLGEQPPKGFGFSDTAFRIFILMASRRLKSDRFFTNDYTPESTRRRAWTGSRAARWSTCYAVTIRARPRHWRASENAFARGAGWTGPPTDARRAAPGLGSYESVQFNQLVIVPTRSRDSSAAAGPVAVATRAGRGRPAVRLMDGLRPITTPGRCGSRDDRTAPAAAVGGRTSAACSRARRSRSRRTRLPSGAAWATSSRCADPLAR